MKIAFYKDTFANNRGADIAVKNLAAGLSERGHAVTLFTKPELADKIQGDYDVILSAGTNELLDLAQFPDLPPVLQQFHTDVTYPFRHWFKHRKRIRRIKAALQAVAGIQVLAPAHAEKLRTLLGGLSPQKISVIGNWSAYETAAKTHPPLPEQKVILCPGALNKDKNQALLINAFAAVAPDFPDWQVHLYGTGKPRETAALEKLIARRGLAGRVHLKGYADLTEAYAACAFAAFPSKTEGFGLVIVDAACFSKPTLTIRDWIGCGTVSSEKRFASDLRALMADADLRARLGAEANAFCREHYSRDTILSQWETALEQTVNQN